MIGGVTTSVDWVGGATGAGVLGGGTAAFFSVIGGNRSVGCNVGGAVERAADVRARRKLDAMELLQTLNWWQNCHGSVQIAEKAASGVYSALRRRLTISGSTESCGASRTGELGGRGTSDDVRSELRGRQARRTGGRTRVPQGRGSPTMRVTRSIGEACAHARACTSDRT